MAPTAEGQSQFIQSWRGIAVFVVVFFHLTDRVPPQALGSAHPPSLAFYSGELGVMAFFVISGYLIAQSLAASSNLASFYAKRLSRIWPLFILANLTIFLAMLVIEPPVVPTGPKAFMEEQATLIDMLATMFFLADLGFRWVDGVFWSILVELKFYFIIGLLAWLSPRNFIGYFGALAVAAGSLELFCRIVGFPGAGTVSWLLNGLLIAQHAPLFAIGAILASPRHRELLTLNIILAACIIAMKVAANPTFSLNGTMFFALALLALLAFDAAVLKRRIVTTVGDYSYSWYLFHQLIGLSLIRMVAPQIGIDAAVLIALGVTFAICVAASWAAEWRFRRLFYTRIYALLSRLGLDRAQVTDGTAAAPAVNAPAPAPATSAP